MKNFYITICAMMFGGLMTLSADSKVVTTINGTPDNRELVCITFDGDNVVLKFADESTLTADMSEVTVALTHGEQSAIDYIKADSEKPSGVYNLKGQRISETPEGLKSGVYIINGQKVFVK